MMVIITSFVLTACGGEAAIPSATSQIEVELVSASTDNSTTDASYDLSDDVDDFFY